MDGDDQRPMNRRQAITAAVAFAATFTATLGGISIAARRATEPKVIVLGAGDDLSVLVTAGYARLLIATGTDTTAFGNALGDSLPLAIRRIDVVLLAGHGRGSAVAAHALRSVAGRSFAIVDPALTAEELDPPRDQRIEIVRMPRRYRLPSDVTVTVEIGAPGDESGADAGWRAIVERGRTRVFILPDGRSAALLPPLNRVSALVLTGGHPIDVVSEGHPAALIVSAEAVSGDALREEVAPVANDDLLALRVYPGEARTLEFVEDGLRLPSGVTSIDGGVPSAGD